MRTIMTSPDDAHRKMTRAKKEYPRGIQNVCPCLYFWLILASKKINPSLQLEITSRYFSKVSTFLIPLRGGRGQIPPPCLYFWGTRTRSAVRQRWVRKIETLDPSQALCALYLGYGGRVGALTLFSDIVVLMMWVINNLWANSLQVSSQLRK